MSAERPKDDGGFLARWSRRKQDAGQADADQPDTNQPGADQAAPGLPAGSAPPAEEPEVPIEELPPLDSIGPDFDIRPWLRRRLPLVWRQAALRRVWATDPMIRDFKGLADYDWDFHTPGALPGFGPLNPGADIPRLLDQALGRSQPTPAEAAEPVPGAPPANRPMAAATTPTPDSPRETAAEVVANTIDTDNQSQEDLPTSSRERETEGDIFATSSHNLPIPAVNDMPPEGNLPARRRGGGATPR